MAGGEDVDSDSWHRPGEKPFLYTVAYQLPHQHVEVRLTATIVELTRPHFAASSQKFPSPTGGQRALIFLRSAL